MKKFLQLLIPFLVLSFTAQAQKNVQQGITTKAVTDDIVLPAGKTLTLSGVLAGTPTGGTLSLANLTLTLPTSFTWAGTLAGANGGTGVANTGKTITLGGNVTTSGAFNLTLTQSANTTVTLPTTGTLATLAGTETLTNKTISGASNTLSAIPNSALGNSTITIAGTSTALGGTITLDTIDNGLASSGLITRTGANTRAARTLTGTAGQVTVTNGDGVSGNPTLSLPTAITGVNSMTAATGQSATLTGGDSGASLVLGAGTAKVTTHTGKQFDAYNRATISTIDSTALAAGNGGGISFGGVFTGSSTTTWAGIFGNKLNATDGDYGAYLAFATRLNGQVLLEKARLTDTGNLLIGTTTDIAGSGGLHVAGTGTASTTTSGAFRVGTNVGLSGNAGGASYFGGGVFASGGGTSATMPFSSANATLGGFEIYSSSASANQKIWQWQAGTAIGDGTIRLRAVNDALSNGSNAISITRTADAVGTISLGTTSAIVSVLGTTAASSSTTGALQVGSNVGLSGNAGGASYFGGSISAANNITATSGTNPVATSDSATILTNSSSPRIALVRNSSTANSRIFEMLNSGDGVVNFRFVNDAYGAATNLLTLNGTSASAGTATFAGAVTMNSAYTDDTLSNFLTGNTSSYSTTLGNYVKTAEVRSGTVLKSNGSIHNNFAAGSFGWYVGQGVGDTAYDTYTPLLGITSSGATFAGAVSAGGNLTFTGGYSINTSSNNNLTFNPGAGIVKVAGSFPTLEVSGASIITTNLQASDDANSISLGLFRDTTSTRRNGWSINNEGSSGTLNDLVLSRRVTNVDTVALRLSNSTGAATFAGAVTTSSGRIIATSVKTDSYTLTASDHFIVYSGSNGSRSITLPAVSGTTGRVYKIKNRASVPVNVVTTAAANEMFTTAATNSVTMAVGDAHEWISDGTFWNLN